jgi:hypothetical protein
MTASRTVSVLGVAGSVPGVHAVTVLPSTAATAGALGSAAFAVTGRQRARLSSSGPAVRVGTVSGAPADTVASWGGSIGSSRRRSSRQRRPV